MTMFIRVLLWLNNLNRDCRKRHFLLLKDARHHCVFVRKVSPTMKTRRNRMLVC
jgi:hypothetical protein